MLKPIVSTTKYLISQPDASMEFFKEIWILRGNLLASDSPETEQAEVDLIGKILFTRFLSDSGFFGENGFPFELLTNQKDRLDFTPLIFLKEQLSLGPLPDPHSVERDALSKLIFEILPRYNWCIVPENSSPALAKPVVQNWILGYIYERWIDNRKTGSYFTADALAYSIVTHAIEEWLVVQYQDKFSDSAPLDQVLQAWKTGEWFDGNPIQETLQWLECILEHIRVVDLSMGGGAFLVATSRALHDLTLFCHSFIQQDITPIGRTALLPRIFSQNLYGIDIMDTAIHIAKMRLWLSGIERGGIVAPLATLPVLPNLIHGDALAALVPSSVAQSTFFQDAPNDPTRVFLTAHGGFDVCVGNPPFIALSQKNHIPQKHVFIENWNQQHSDYVLRTTSDLSNFFILQGANVLRANGALAYITSRNFFDTRYGEPIRKFLTQEVELRYLFTLHDHPFTQQGLKVKANTVILSLIRRRPHAPLRFQDLTAWNESLSNRGCEVDREELRASSNWTQTLFHDPLRAELQRQCPKKLGDYANARMGIKSGDNSFFLLRADSDLLAAASPETSEDVFIKAIRNSRDIRGFVLPQSTPYRLLNLQVKIPQVEYGFSPQYRLKGIAQYIHQRGVAYQCPHCQEMATREHAQHPDRYPHRGMCAKCSDCRKENNPCDRPVDRLSNQGHRPEWYTLSLTQLPAIAVQCIVDTEIGVFWNDANVYATDQFQTIAGCSDPETTKILFLFLCSRIARFLLEGSALHRARFDGSFMLKIQVNHLSDLPCPDFNQISPNQKENLLQLFNRIIAIADRRSEQASRLVDDVDRAFLEILGYSADSIDLVQAQLGASLEKAVLFRWTKTRTRNNAQ